MYKPHPTLFILRSLQPKRRSSLPTAFRWGLSDDTITKVGSLPFGDVFDASDLKLFDPNGDNSAALNLLRSQFGNCFAVEPVLQDKHGKLLFPTGEITIRFKKTLTKKQMALFAKEHSLVFVEQNEFIKEQAKFQLDPSKHTHLLEVLARLKGAAPIEMAWPVTLSSYQRGEHRSNEVG